ncbi:CPC_1213 family protein [uncultured Clostridium sp.]|nr:CPC_1213 family protein [uncultured Clostridium sp.]
MGKSMKADNSRKKKHVSHNAQEESVKAVFGEPKAKKYDPSDFKI